jgi:hypothetical protein
MVKKCFIDGINFENDVAIVFCNMDTSLLVLTSGFCDFYSNHHHLRCLIAFVFLSLFVMPLSSGILYFDFT